MHREHFHSGDSCFWCAKRSDEEEQQESLHTSLSDDSPTVFEAFGER